MTLTLNNEFNLYQEKSGQIFCDSIQIAETFHKRHDNVLADIRALTDFKSGVSEEFNLLNFKEIKYKDSKGRRYPKFLLAKDGFTLLVMSYKGKKAMAFKIAYINRFNQMESYIKTLFEVRLDFPELTEAMQYFYAEPKSYHYSNELDMINRIVLGMKAKKFKETHGIDESVSSIRPFLTMGQIESISRLQKADIGLLYAGKSYDERKSILTGYHNRHKQCCIA